MQLFCLFSPRKNGKFGKRSFAVVLSKCCNAHFSLVHLLCWLSTLDWGGKREATGGLGLELGWGAGVREPGEKTHRFEAILAERHRVGLEKSSKQKIGNDESF